MSNQTQLPTSTSPLSQNVDFISRGKSTIYSHLSTRRPWRQLLALHHISCPTPLSQTLFPRLKTNLSFFRVNFAIIILLIVFLSLLWNPLSLIVFLIIMIAWVFLFILRDEPLVVFGRSIDDRVVIAVLSVVTIGCLLLTGSILNIVISVSVGIGVVLIFSVFRKTDDLYLDEDEAAGSGLISGRGGV